MQGDAGSIEQYLATLPVDRREAISTVRDVLLAHMPKGYVEQMAELVSGLPVDEPIARHGAARQR